MKWQVYYIDDSIEILVANSWNELYAQIKMQYKNIIRIA